MRILIFIFSLLYFTNLAAQDAPVDAPANVVNASKKCHQKVKGLVKDRVTKELLPNTIVSIQDDAGNPIASQMIHKDGEFVFELECDTKYRLKAIKKSYTLETKSFATTSTSGIELKTEIFLDKGSINFISKSKSVAARKAQTESKSVAKVSASDMKPIAKVSTTNPVEEKEEKEAEQSETVVAHIAEDNKEITEEVSADTSIVQNTIEEETPTEVKKEVQEIVANASVDTQKESLKTTKNKDQQDILVLQPIIFDYESSYLNKQAKQELRKVVNILKENPDIILECASYTDAKGTEKYNQWMSDRRAKRTVDYIVARGISPSRISGKGYGEAKLLIPCEDDCTDEQRAVNRRTEFIVVKK